MCEKPVVGMVFKLALFWLIFARGVGQWLCTYKKQFYVVAKWSSDDW